MKYGMRWLFEGDLVKRLMLCCVACLIYLLRLWREVSLNSQYVLG
jgi:hypothetical protein